MKKFIFSLMLISIIIMSLGPVFADVYIPGTSHTNTQYMPYDNLAGTIVSILSTLAPLIAFICFIIGVIYLIKSKQSTRKKTLIGLSIIIIPIILSVILSAINMAMHIMY